MPRKKRSRLSAEERKRRGVQSTHRRLIRAIFRNTGFERFTKLADRPFKIGDHIESDFDDVFVCENIVVCAEYTTSKSDNVGDHLRKKKIVYDEATENPTMLVETLAAIDSDFSNVALGCYRADELVVRFVYCSRYDFDAKHKTIAANAEYLDYPELRYFKSLTDSIKLSARAELLDFLRVGISQIGKEGKVDTHSESKSFQATVLPEANSNFDAGFKVVSFYVDPETLLNQAYVLRRQGWRDSDSVYQRMISKSKIDEIRRHLKLKKRVFVNNIIATLDDETRIIDEDGNVVDPSKITKTTSVELQLPARQNTVGLIDGQHRTFSYYISSPDDPEIAKLRRRQNLLVTGIIYPPRVRRKDRETFEARLFLEINSTQTNAKSDLKQAINRLVDPFSDESIAAAVVEKLGRGSGPLAGQIMRHWFDTDKLKTSSVVSYGMKPLTKTSGVDSMFFLWNEPEKQLLLKKNDTEILDTYIEFCCDQIDAFLIAVKRALPSNLWTPDKRVPGRLLTTTVINSLLICLRKLIESGKTGGVEHYENRLKGLSERSFNGYHSSQYAKLAQAIFDKHFG